MRNIDLVKWLFTLRNKASNISDGAEGYDDEPSVVIGYFVKWSDEDEEGSKIAYAVAKEETGDQKRSFVDIVDLVS